jgi:hypothetical protein
MLSADAGGAWDSGRRVQNRQVTTDTRNNQCPAFSLGLIAVWETMWWTPRSSLIAIAISLSAFAVAFLVRRLRGSALLTWASADPVASFWWVLGGFMAVFLTAMAPGVAG